MQIKVRNAPTGPTEPEGSACNWIIGDDGETQQTLYLERDQEVAVNIEFNPGHQSAEIGEPTSTEQAAPSE
jgi:hypothetical protein